MVVPIDRIPNMPTRVRRALEGIGSEFVPYTGAIKDVDLGAFDLTATEITATAYASAYSIRDFVVLHVGGELDGDTCVGILAGAALTTGTYDTLLGWSAGKAMTSGYDNICIGASAGILLTVGFKNVLIGKEAGASLVGDSGDVTIGDQNTFIGYFAGNLATKSYNTAIGPSACQYMTTGTKNTCIGHLAGGDLAVNPLTSGIENTFIGANSGRKIETCVGCTGIGYFTGAATAGTFLGSVAIGRAATFTASNQLVIGGDGPNYRITDVYIGDGVVIASPQDVTINPTGGSGTDTEAKDLILAGGKSTGDAAPGDILFKTSTAGASGSTLQSLTTRLTLTGVTADFAGLNLTTTGSMTTGTLTVSDGSIIDSDGTIAIGGGGGADVLNLTTNKVYITRGDLTLQSGGTTLTAPNISGDSIAAAVDVITPNFTAASNVDLLIINYVSNYDIIFTFNDGGVSKSFTIDASENTLDLDAGHLTTTGDVSADTLTTTGAVTSVGLICKQQLDIQWGGQTLLAGADNNASSRTNATNKFTRWGMPHYLNAEEPAAFLVGTVASGVNNFVFGGGTSVYNAATNIQFYTAANSTTLTGTPRYEINSAGNHDFKAGNITTTGVVTATNLILSKVSGNGIKVDVSAPTFGWRDLLGDVSIKTIGANDPDYSNYAATGIYRYQFKNNVVTEIFNDFHIPHDYVPGTEVYVHIHWSQTTIDTGGAAAAPGNAKWYFDVNYSKGHDRGAFPAGVVTVSVVQTASGTIRKHMIAEVQLSTSGQIGGQDLEPDGIVTVRTYRDAADGADTLDQRPWVHHVDIHYQSTNIATKDKVPDFYV